MGRLAAFGVSVAVLWALFFVIGPRVVAQLPALQHYGEVQDIYGIRSGQLYYTDVEMSQQAEINSRSTWRFTPTGPTGTAGAGRSDEHRAASPAGKPVAAGPASGASGVVGVTGAAN